MKFFLYTTFNDTFSATNCRNISKPSTPTLSALLPPSRTSFLKSPDCIELMLTAGAFLYAKPFCHKICYFVEVKPLVS